MTVIVLFKVVTSGLGTIFDLPLNTSLAKQPEGLGQCTYSLVEDKALRYIL